MASMLNLKLALPLADTPASRFLAWIAGGLVFLAVIAFALAAAANGTVARLALEPRAVTVALPAGGSRTVPDAETARVLAALEGLDGVAFARPVEPQELGKLVAPWFGQGAELAALPMPRLVDVGFNPGRGARPRRARCGRWRWAPGRSCSPPWSASWSLSPG